MQRILLLIAIIMCVACLPTNLPSGTQVNIVQGELLLSENFSTQSNWSEYNTNALTITVTDGVYQMLLNQDNQYIWGTINQNFDNSIIEVDVTWLSDNDYAFTGVICRLQENNGLGYYVVVSQSGDFSIRYTGRNRDDAIVVWQSDSQIPRSGTFRMRVECVNNYIALYINDRFIDSATDSRLREGQVGLAVGMPDISASGAIAFVAFDNLQVWDANLP